MLKDVIFFSAYPFVLCIFLRLHLIERRDTANTLFLIGVALIPIGKLFYMPVPGLFSVTAAFVFTTITAGLSLTVNFIKGIDKFVFIPFIACIPAFLSMLFLYDALQSIFLSDAGAAVGGGSPLLRLAAVLFTCLYCAYVVLVVSKNENSKRDIATYYIFGTLFATVIGFFITYGIFFGRLTPTELLPISVEDVHVTGRLFRFNPGASVNEFGEIIGYAIFMLRWTGWRTSLKITAAVLLLSAEFLSLTRGAWLALVAGYIAYAFFTGSKQRSRIFLAAGTAAFALFLVALASPDIRQLAATRIAFDAGPGGDDRLLAATTVFDAVNASTLRLLFGYGWSSDIFSNSFGYDAIGYIHNVPLMFMFDTGMVGLTFCAIVFYAFGRFTYSNLRQDRDIFAGIIMFMFTLSMFEHIYFHLQTWLMFGLILGIGLHTTRGQKHALIASPVARPAK